jgi:hypothetical protein
LIEERGFLDVEAWRPVPKLFLQYEAEETNPAGLILEQMFSFGKGWKGGKFGCGNCEARRNQA